MVKRTNIPRRQMSIIYLDNCLRRVLDMEAIIIKPASLVQFINLERVILEYCLKTTREFAVEFYADIFY